MPDVMSERNRANQVTIQPERTSNHLCQIADILNVFHARADVVVLRIEENLCLVTKSAERHRVNNSSDVALVSRANSALAFGTRATATLRRERCSRVQQVTLRPLFLQAGAQIRSTGIKQHIVHHCQSLTHHSSIDNDDWLAIKRLMLPSKSMTKIASSPVSVMF
jgi:hypothetical protein